VQEVLCAGGINHLDREHVEPLMRALITEIPPTGLSGPVHPRRGAAARKGHTWLNRPQSRHRGREPSSGIANRGAIIIANPDG